MCQQTTIGRWTVTCVSKPRLEEKQLHVKADRISKRKKLQVSADCNRKRNKLHVSADSDKKRNSYHMAADCNNKRNSYMCQQTVIERGTVTCVS